MTAWCHLPTILNQRRALWITGLIALCAAFITTLLFAHASYAVPNTNKVINFQGRLTYPTGGVVADGYYNIQFKIYQGGDGKTAGNGGITPSWIESYTNNNTNAGVYVKGGYFSVSLGEKSPFGSLVDWDNDTLWLSMNVGGTAANCTSFGGAGCTGDGEMLPMQRMTAVPYALNAGALNGKSADNFVQIAQGVQTDASNNTSSIFINKTGTNGNFAQLQNDGTDVLRIGNTGDLEFGGAQDHTISVAQSGTNTQGGHLGITAGTGGSGDGATGGYLILQGGNAGGTNGDGGSVVINGGNGTGTGHGGTIYIGSSNDSNIQIGNTNLAGSSQGINIGTNTGSGTTFVTIGSSGSAGGGTTTLQAKDTVSIKTNDVTRATFTNSNSVYFGNGVSAATPDNFTIQGTNSAASGTAGGSLTVQGGNATTGNANGGNITLSGGTGSGTGSSGLVVMTTPTFSTVTNDSNCYTGGAPVASNCTVSAATVNSSSAVIVGFSTDGKIATLPAPANTTAGRIIYVMAAGGSHNFTLRANTGSAAEQSIAMRANMTATMIWNGSAWTAAGGSNASTLQNVYDNNPQGPTADIVLNKTTSTNGLAIKDSVSDPINGNMLAVKNATDSAIFSVNSAASNEYATNPGAETAGGSASTFPANTWGSVGAASISRYTTAGNYIANGSASVKVNVTGGLSGAKNQLTAALLPSKTYNVTMKARLESGSFTDFGVNYSADGTNLAVDCSDDVEIVTTEWRQVSCSFQTPASGITAQNFIAIGQTNAATHTFYIDDLSVAQSDSASSSVKIGTGNNTGNATLFTLDKSPTAPTAPSNEALLGSMYYDTTIGKVQCFEADGWGACSAQPDTFVLLSPEYPNAVINTTGTGTFSSGFCSNALNINDGTSGQPLICGSNDTYNFYQWSSTQGATQTRSIYVNYQLPSNFKKFVAGSTSLSSRTNSSDAAVRFVVFRNRPGTSLTMCGTPTTASTGAVAWQKTTTALANDPASCGFSPGDSLVMRIDVESKNSATAYVSNFNFAFSNND